MRLVVFSHKPCWHTPNSPSGFATNGGFPFQMAALSDLFDETHLLVPASSSGWDSGEIPLQGHHVQVAPLSPRRGSGLSAKFSFVPWLLWNGPAMLRELLRADGVHAPIPGDVGTVGMLGAFLLRKPLFVRHCGNWLKPCTAAEKFWRWFMERFAGGRNVMLATGGTSEPPSQKNPNLRWIFSSSLTQYELNAYASPRSYPSNADIRLVHAARQETAKGAGAVIRSLPLLAQRFPKLNFEIIGDGSAIPGLRQLAQEAGVAPRVQFAGKLSHEAVMQRLQNATLFIFPTTASDGFPKVVLEGLASGLPVVATRVSVLPQLLGTGCGVLLDEATAEAVARGVEEALRDPAQYEAMSRQAVETARQYSLEAWRDTIGRYLSAAWGPLKARDETGKQKAESRKQKSAISSPVTRGP